MEVEVGEGSMVVDEGGDGGWRWRGAYLLVRGLVEDGRSSGGMWMTRSWSGVDDFC